jgi:tetratricopeptide (TPR) repeat protein
MTRTVLCVAVLAAGILFPSASAADDMAVCADRNAPGAIAACTRLIEAQLPGEQPGAASLYFQRGIAFHVRDRKDQALQDFVEASRRDPNDADALIWSASIHHDHRNWPAAIAAATEALRRNPDRPAAYNVRGDALTQIGEHERAIADLTETLRREPEFRVAYINRAAAYRKIGRDDLALTDYETVTGLRPDWEVGHRRRAELLVKLGRHAEAIPSLTRRIEIARHYDHFADRADAYAGMGERERALADYDAAIERAHLRKLFAKRAMVHLAGGDIAAAMADAKTAIAARSFGDLSPGLTLGIFVLGVLMSWIKAVLGVAAALVIRRPVVGATVAAAVGAGEFLLSLDGGLPSIWTLLQMDESRVATAVLSAAAGVAWWGLGRALGAMTSFGRSSGAAGKGAGP